MGVYIKGMKMPKNCAECPCEHYECLLLDKDAEDIMQYFTGDKRHPDCPLIELSPHGRLIDADALIADLKRQCREVFRVDAVSPDDFWITRNEAYNERLWETWCESFFGYLRTRPTIIEAEVSE